METSGLKDFLTIGCAVLGAALGLINTWHGLNQRRVKLKVIPKAAYPVSIRGELGPEMGCIEVTNLSAFPLTISDVGFTIAGDLRKKARAPILRPILQDGGPWPRRLEPRTAVTAYFYWQGIDHRIKKAYAKTDCGEVAHGSSPALKSIRDRLA